MVAKIPKVPQRLGDGSGAAAPGNSRMEKSLDHGETVGESAKRGAHPALSHNPLLEKGKKKVGISEPCQQQSRREARLLPVLKEREEMSPFWSPHPFTHIKLPKC